MVLEKFSCTRMRNILLYLYYKRRTVLALNSSVWEGSIQYLQNTNKTPATKKDCAKNTHFL